MAKAQHMHPRRKAPDQPQQLVEGTGRACASESHRGCCEGQHAPVRVFTKICIAPRTGRRPLSRAKQRSPGRQDQLSVSRRDVDEVQPLDQGV